jgi:hypothetical protein
MNVPYTVKVPVDIAMALKDREATMKLALMKDLKDAQKGSVDERRKVEEKIKAVSYQNMLRVCLRIGFPTFVKLNDSDLLNRLMAPGSVVRGRPSRAA